MDATNDTSPALADYVRPIWQRKWLVIFVVLVATGGTYLYTKRQPKLYEAGTLVYYQPATDPLSNGQIPTTDRQVEDVAALLYSQANAAAVARAIKYPGTPAQLSSQVTISDRAGEDFVAISGESGEPREAATIANGYAQQLVTLTNSAQQQRLIVDLQGLKKELAQIGQSPADVTTRESITSDISTIQIALLSPTGTKQVSAAVAPSTPASPKPVQDALFALVLSLALAVAATFGLERFDRRLKHPEDLGRYYGLPLLAALPHSSDPAWQHDGVADLGAGFHEPFALLRTNIHLLTLDARPRTIAVVSAVPGEGKSTVVRNLAIALAESGDRVAVIETDLRRPTQSSLFGLPAVPGLTDVLGGSASLADALHEVPAPARGIRALSKQDRAASANASPNGRSHESEESTLGVLVAGTHPPNPMIVLESASAVELLDELKSEYDVLILDSAPMLSVTDSVPLVRYADATLIVGRLGLTTRDNVRHMASFLERMPDARVLGVVANDFTELASYGYPYASAYYSSEVRRPKVETSAETAEPAESM